MENSLDVTVRPPSPWLGGAEKLWEDLALAAGSQEPRPDGRELAMRINDAAPSDRQPVAISTTVIGMVADAAEDEADAPSAARVSEFLVHLKPSVLTAALRTETDLDIRRSFLENAARVLTLPAVLRLALAASAAYERPLSAPMRELLVRLGRTALGRPTPAREEAERLIRDLVTRKLEVAPPDAVAAGRGIGGTLRAAAPRRTAGRVTPEADRIVQMCLETGAPGELLRIALSEMIDEGRAGELFEMVKRVPGNAATAAVLGRIATPAALSDVLGKDPVDFSTVDLLVAAMGIAAAKPLVEAVAESRSRATRRGAHERLSRLGPDIAPLVEGRLRDTRWFVVRNMLSLLREAGADVEPSVVDRFLTHTDPRVRREAIQIQLRHPRSHEDALVRSLRDTDPSVIRAGLQSAREKMTESIAPLLAKRVADADFPPEFRVIAIDLLARSSSTLALEALLHYAQAGSTLLGKTRLAAKSAEMLAAVRGLARSWPNERRARPILDAASQSRDEQIRSAAKRPGGVA